MLRFLVLGLLTLPSIWGKYDRHFDDDNDQVRQNNIRMYRAMQPQMEKGAIVSKDDEESKVAKYREQVQTLFELLAAQKAASDKAKSKYEEELVVREAAWSKGDVPLLLARCKDDLLSSRARLKALGTTTGTTGGGVGARGNSTGGGGGSSGSEVLGAVAVEARGDGKSGQDTTAALSGILAAEEAAAKDMAEAEAKAAAGLQAAEAKRQAETAKHEQALEDLRAELRTARHQLNQARRLVELGAAAGGAAGAAMAGESGDGVFGGAGVASTGAVEAEARATASEASAAAAKARAAASEASAAAAKARLELVSREAAATAEDAARLAEAQAGRITSLEQEVAEARQREETHAQAVAEMETQLQAAQRRAATATAAASAAETAALAALAAGPDKPAAGAAAAGAAATDAAATGAAATDAIAARATVSFDDASYTAGLMASSWKDDLTASGFLLMPLFATAAVSGCRGSKGCSGGYGSGRGSSSGSGGRRSCALPGLIAQLLVLFPRLLAVTALALAAAAAATGLDPLAAPTAARDVTTGCGGGGGDSGGGYGDKARFGALDVLRSALASSAESLRADCCLVGVAYAFCLLAALALGNGGGGGKRVARAAQLLVLGLGLVGASLSPLVGGNAALAFGSGATQDTEFQDSFARGAVSTLRYVMLAVAMALLAFIEPLRIAVCGDGAASSFDRKFAVALAGLSSPGSSFDGPHAAFSGIGSPGARQTFDLGTIAHESRWPDDVRSSVHGHGRRGGEQLQLRLQRHSADHSLLMPMDVHALSREQLRRSGELESLEGGGGGGVGGDRWGSSSPGGSLVSGGKSGGALLRALSLPGDEWHADPQKRSPRKLDVDAECAPPMVNGYPKEHASPAPKERKFSVGTGGRPASKAVSPSSSSSSSSSSASVSSSSASSSFSSSIRQRSIDKSVRAAEPSDPAPPLPQLSPFFPTSPPSVGLQVGHLVGGGRAPTDTSAGDFFFSKGVTEEIDDTALLAAKSRSDSF